MGREAMIRESMEALGVYSPAYDKAIHDLAKAERTLSRAEKAWKKSGGQMVAQLVNKTGGAYTAKDPQWAVVEQLRKDITAQRKDLGLLPSAARRAKPQKAEQPPGNIALLLEQAAAHAAAHGDEYAAEVEGYVSGVLSGALNVCEEIRLACERYRRDLVREDLDFRPECANELIAIIETTICHQQGEQLDATPMRGKPFLLMAYHKFIVYNVMGFFKAGTAERRYKEALDFIPRKNAKTTFAAALAWGIALLDRRSGATVYEVGGALKQALQGFDFLRYNLRRLRITTDDDPVAGLRIANNNMEHSISGDIGEDGYISINALAASPERQDSLNANVIIADELHTYKSAQQYQVLKDATKAYTNRLVIGISSGGHLSNGFCARRVDYCRKILNGTITGPEADSIFAFIACAPQDCGETEAYTDPKILEAANPGWGQTIRPQDMLNDAMQAKNDPQMRPEFLAKSLNVFVAAMRAWFDVEEWRRSDRKYNWTLAELAKLPIKWYGGTDLSKLHDLTAGCIFGHYGDVDILIPHAWFPRTAAHVKAWDDDIPLFGWEQDGWLDLCEDAVLNHHDVVKWYADRRKDGFNFRRIGHDRKFCREYFMEMQSLGFPVRDQPQLFTRKSEGFRYLEASAKRGTLYYCHAEPMEYCVGNVQGSEMADDMVQYKKVADHRRIDVFDAAVFAACSYLEDMAQAKKVNNWFGNS